MYASLNSCSLIGLDGIMVQVEVDISRGIPAFEIVGLPDAAVREAKERVRAAIKNSGFQLPPKRITINLAPGDKRKAGTHFDLVIALGILKATGQMELMEKQEQNLSFDSAILGELALDGYIRGVEGVLPMAMTVLKEGYNNLIVPSINEKEAMLVKGINIYSVSSLKGIVGILSGAEPFSTTKAPAVIEKNSNNNVADNQNQSIGDIGAEKDIPDFGEVRGQYRVKRALEIAAAGGHNVMIVGPAGTGKSMLAKRTAGILPGLDFHESLEVTKIYSVAGLLKKGKGLITKSPVRSPHHGVTGAALIGGGKDPVPGEISLAHKGILLLDELSEFSSRILDQLRQPLEDKEITISRYASTVTYPADFMLIATMNPCYCGNYYSPELECTCSDLEIRKYHKKISSPLKDRIDIQIEAPPLEFEEIKEDKSLETSTEIRFRVVKARKIQRHRYKNIGVVNNSGLNHSQIKKYCRLNPEGERLLKVTYKKFNLNVRSHDRILKIARTVADLAGESSILTHHLAEAIAYRGVEMEMNTKTFPAN